MIGRETQANTFHLQAAMNPQAEHTYVERQLTSKTRCGPCNKRLIGSGLERCFGDKKAAAGNDDVRTKDSDASERRGSKKMNRAIKQDELKRLWWSLGWIVC